MSLQLLIARRALLQAVVFDWQQNWLPDPPSGFLQEEIERLRRQHEKHLEHLQEIDDIIEDHGGNPDP